MKKIYLLISIIILFLGCIGGGQTGNESKLKESDLSIEKLKWESLELVNVALDVTDCASGKALNAIASISFVSEKDDLQVTFIYINDQWIDNALVKYVHGSEFTYIMKKGSNELNDPQGIEFFGYCSIEEIKEIKYCFTESQEKKVPKEGDPGVICKTEKISDVEINKLEDLEICSGTSCFPYTKSAQ